MDNQTEKLVKAIERLILVIEEQNKLLAIQLESNTRKSYPLSMLKQATKQ